MLPRVLTTHTAVSVCRHIQEPGNFLPPRFHSLLAQASAQRTACVQHVLKCRYGPERPRSASKSTLWQRMPINAEVDGSGQVGGW
eukprot:3925463-Amphidinium_carterae.1